MVIIRNVFSDQNTFLQAVTDMVEVALNEHKLLQGEWQHGKVVEVLSSKMLALSINGSEVSQKVPCNPDIVFNVGDEVWVVYINRNSNDKFVISRRAI